MLYDRPVIRAYTKLLSVRQYLAKIILRASQLAERDQWVQKREFLSEIVVIKYIISFNNYPNRY